MIEAVVRREESAEERHLLEDLGEPGLTGIKISRCYEGVEEVDPSLLKELLLDPVAEEWVEEATPFTEAQWRVSVQFRHGVTDNPGKTAEIALFDRTGRRHVVRSGRRYYLFGELPRERVEKIATGWLANPLIEEVVVEPAAPYEIIEQLDEEVSRRMQLALSSQEIATINAYFAQPEVEKTRLEKGLPSRPTDVEIECLAQTWSEHCKHKIFNARIEMEAETIDSVFKTYIRGSTEKLLPSSPWVVSVFSDNAGIVELTDKVHLAFKVETHNSPSALDPYGGALTGILGVMRDAMGCGVGARLVACTDVFCFADPDYAGEIPARLMHPKRILRGVRRGVEHGGNKMGVPTVNGSLVFDERYLGKPLVYCGAVGLLPSEVVGNPSHEKKILPGDLVVVAGGRTGRDGIHGATFSSEALTESSPTSAVQIGDPFTQKKLHDFLLDARDAGLIRTLTDNGAGGVSSSVGEMAELSNGAVIDLARLPVKESGLRAWELLVSESQERMTLAVAKGNYQTLQSIASKHEVEISSIGRFTDAGVFEVRYQEERVGYLPLDFLHDGAPQMELKAKVRPPQLKPASSTTHPDDLGEVLLQLLARPNICSKEGVVRQYDHEVQGQTIGKPLCGRKGEGPSNGAVIQPLEVVDQRVGFALGHGLYPRFSDIDAYAMAAHSIDEALRNVVAVGGNPAQTALLDNFSWPDPTEDEHKMGQLVQACQALYDYTVEFGTPLISGKDSMKNDYRIDGKKISVPPTLLVSALARVDDVERSTSMEFKRSGDVIYLVGPNPEALAGSEYAHLIGDPLVGSLPLPDPKLSKEIFTTLHAAIQSGVIASCHDLSDGGLAVALAEAAIGGDKGAQVDLPTGVAAEQLFSEGATRFLLSVPPTQTASLEERFGSLPLTKLGKVTEEKTLTLAQNGKELFSLPTKAMRKAWQSNKELS